MFKIALMMVILAAGFRASAFMPLPLNCSNEDQQTLEVTNSGFRADGTPFVHLKFFNGEAIQVMRGVDNSTLEKNEIELPLGDSLKVGTPRLHGGRCGRCAPSNNLPDATVYFAKLTLASQVYNFLCTSL